MFSLSTGVPQRVYIRSVIINDELDKIYAWLAINKLSLTINKTEDMIFHAINKPIEGVIPNLIINGIQIDRVNFFIFFGLNLHENMSWKTHTEFVANKLAKYSGVLNKINTFIDWCFKKNLFQYSRYYNMGFSPGGLTIHDLINYMNVSSE